MALTVGDNSYISLADAEIYFSDRLHTEAWDAITDDAVKSASLIQATKIIDRENRFKGSRLSTTQKLAFPRSDIYIDGIEVDYLTVPQDIIDAVCEYAIYLVQDDITAPDDLSAYNSVQISSIKVDLKDSGSPSRVPPMVKMLLSGYVDTAVRLVRG